MKKLSNALNVVLLCTLAITYISSCKKDNHNVTKSNIIGTRYVSRTLPQSEINSSFIPVDSANMMISSYLTSIKSANNDSDIHSFIFDADSLRKYLNDTSEGKIVKVKLIMAHTMSYIRSGNAGTNCGYQTGALTIIVAGVSSSNNYIYNKGTVLEHAAPCPNNCFTGGTASNDQLY